MHDLTINSQLVMVSSMAVEADHVSRAHADPIRMAVLKDWLAGSAMDHNHTQP
jgi:hypothetical protein